MSEDPISVNDAPSTDPKLLAEAQEVVNSLTKTSKVFRTYPRENTISITAIDNLLQTFATYLEKHESLEFFVNRHELLFGGTPVYSDADPRRSFALKLDRDGVRRMTFHKDIRREEVVGLLEVLTTEIGEESLEDDVVTLLWEKQLEHVKVFVLDDAAPGESGYNPGLAGAGELKGNNETPETPRPENRAGATFRKSMEATAPEQGGQPSLCLTTKAKMSPVTPEQSQVLADRTKQEETQDVSEDLEDILFDVLQTEADTEVCGNAAKVLLELVMMRVKETMLAPAADLLGHLRVLAGTEGMRPEVREQIDAQLRALGDPAHVAVIIETLRAHENLSLSDLSRFLVTLPPEAAPGLCNLMGMERYDKTVRTALKDLVKNNPRMLVPKFLEADAETGKKLLGILEGLVDADVVAELTGPLTAGDDALKTASMKLLESVKCPASCDLLMGFAASANPTLRRGALRALSSFPAQDAPAQPLRAETQAKDFDERALDEKKMLFAAIAKIEGRVAVDFLVGIVGQRHWFEKEHHAETRACAALALGDVDDDAAFHALEQCASDKSEAVTTAVRLARGKHKVPAAAGVTP